MVYRRDSLEPPTRRCPANKGHSIDAWLLGHGCMIPAGFRFIRLYGEQSPPVEELPLPVPLIVSCCDSQWRTTIISPLRKFGTYSEIFQKTTLQSAGQKTLAVAVLPSTVLRV